ncbi:hypothetical protein OD350_18120 [Clostridium beijerinckii]|uniref:hypothetical protein n=1 Tax=Clostridium beijerinckii TaxID=1520 RepID=UPI0022280780|nr:hypothetical protein [Clostridium beijerinckii]UYZ34161.1 hypothetical protein OD350_18120 [Clostridium beijerinckii]
MDKIKTIVIEDNQLIQDSGITKLTSDYIELIPKNYIVKYLKFNVSFKNWIPKPISITTPTITDNTDTSSDPLIDETTTTDTTKETVVTPIIDEIVNDTRFPFIKINGELCPIMIQQDYEIKSEDRFEIESLMINNSIGLGSMTMILVSYGKKL